MNFGDVFVITDEKVYEVEDRDPNLYVQRAEDALKRRSYSEALKEMDQAIKFVTEDGPQDHVNHYIFEKLKVYEAIGKDSSCVDFIKKHIRRLYHYLPLKEFYRVLALYQKHAKLYSNDLEGILSENHIPGVLSETYRSSSYGTREYLLNRAQDFREKKQYKKALECIAVIEDKYVGDLGTCLLRARISRDQGLLKDALSYYRSAGHRSDATIDVFNEITEIHRKLKQMSEGKKWIDMGLKKFPEHTGLLFQKAEILYSENEYDEALAVLDFILSKKRLDAKALHLKGIIYDQKGYFLNSNRLLNMANTLDRSLVVPKNESREQFLAKLKQRVVSASVLVMAILIGQLVMFMSGTFKPIISSASVWTEEDEIFVGETVEVSQNLKVFPFYAEEPNDVEVVMEDPEVATLDSNGELLGLKEGTTSVQLVWDDEVLDSQMIEIVKPKVTELNLEISNEKLEVGDSATVSTDLVMDYDEADLPEFTYNSSNPDIVEVNQEGEIQANGVGQAVITVKAEGYSESIPVVVRAKIEEINFDMIVYPIQIGQNFTLAPTVVAVPEEEETWSLSFESLDPTIVEVDKNGAIRALAFGETVITASSPGGIEKTVKVRVTPNKVQGLSARYNESSNSIHLEWSYDETFAEKLDTGEHEPAVDGSFDGAMNMSNSTSIYGEQENGNGDGNGNGNNGNSTINNNSSINNDTPDQGMSYEINIEQNGSLVKTLTTSDKNLEFTNPVSGSTYTFRVAVVFQNNKSVSETVSVKVPLQESIDSGMNEQEYEEEGESVNPEEAALNAKRQAAMDKLVGYWKRTDPLRDNQNHADRFIFIYGGDTHWRMDFQSYNASGQEADIHLGRISLNGNQLKHDDNITVTIHSNTLITVNYYKLWGDDGKSSGSAKVTIQYKKVDKSQVDQEFLDRYPHTKLPE